MDDRCPEIVLSSAESIPTRTSVVASTTSPAAIQVIFLLTLLYFSKPCQIHHRLILLMWWKGPFYSLAESSHAGWDSGEFRRGKIALKVNLFDKSAM
jgi:hypothetical protein